MKFSAVNMQAVNATLHSVGGGCKAWRIRHRGGEILITDGESNLPDADDTVVLVSVYGLEGRLIHEYTVDVVCLVDIIESETDWVYK